MVADKQPVPDERSHRGQEGAFLALPLAPIGQRSTHEPIPM